MSKATVQFNDYVSLAVMALMIIALVTGQASADVEAERAFAKRAEVIAIEHLPAVIANDRLSINLDGQLGDQALKLSIAVVGDLNHFRGEDE